MPSFKDKYKIEEQLGKGAYAVVYRCINRVSGFPYAVKVVDKSKTGPKDIADVTHEIQVMQKIGYHPHVVQLVDFFQSERHMYLVLDLLEGGMLFDRIIELKHYSERDATHLVRHFLSALAHIHSKGIIHRDLKPENLLLRRKQTSRAADMAHLTDVCLADFGLAGNIPSYICCGSPSYIAPEVINVGYLRTQTEPYNEKCDIWSLGVITYILLSGKMPFHGKTFKETFQRIVTNQWSFVGDTWEHISPAAKDFIKFCLSPDPKLRPSAKEALKHPWMDVVQPNFHLAQSLEGLRRFTAQEKLRAAVRVFCATHSLLGQLDRTPPFMKYLRHKDKYSTVIEAQSQTSADRVHFVDFGVALKNNEKGWRMKDCCTCSSELVCRHIQNVHEYLFVGKRSMDVYPFINELMMLEEEALEELQESPTDPTSVVKLERVRHAINAAHVFSEELGKVPSELKKPNFMLDGTANNMFWLSGGSRSVIARPEPRVGEHR